MNLIIVINVERKSNPAEMRGTRARWGGGWHLLMDTSSDSPAPQSLFNCSMPCRPRGDACGSAAVSDARHRWTPRTLAAQGKQKHNWCCSRLLRFPQKLVTSPASSRPCFENLSVDADASNLFLASHLPPVSGQWAV